MEINSQLPQVPTSQVTAADAKKIEKISNAVAGMEVVDAVTEKLEEDTKKLVEKSMEKKESSTTDSNKDSATITSTVKEQEKIAQKIKFRIKAWTLEMQEELWDTLFDYTPSSQKPLSEDIKALQKLYSDLKEAILQNYTGQEQIEQLAKLENALFSVSDKMITEHIQELFNFLGKYSSPDATKTIQLSIFQAIAKNQPQYVSLERLLQQTREVMRENFNTPFSTGGKQSNYTLPSKTDSPRFHSPMEAQKRSDANGFIYQKLASGKVGINAKLSRSEDFLQSDLKMLQNEVKLESSKTLLLSQPNGKSFLERLVTMRDLEQTTKFVEHINKEGFVFSPSETKKLQEPVLGVITGITALKSEVFQNAASITPNMSFILKQAMDQLVFYYIYQAKNTQVKQPDSYQKDFGQEAFRQEEVLHIYHYILEAFEKVKDPTEAILQGIRYAFGLYEQKKKSKDSSQNARGFFPEVWKNDVEIGWFEGLKTIRNNWNQFVQSMQLKNMNGMKIQSSFEKQSPWLLVSSGASFKEGKKVSLSFVPVWVIVFVLLVIGMFSFAIGYGQIGGSLLAAGVVLAGILAAKKFGKTKI